LAYSLGSAPGFLTAGASLGLATAFASFPPTFSGSLGIN